MGNTERSTLFFKYEEGNDAMGLNHRKLASTLAHLEHDGLLPDDGPTSVFLCDGPVRRQLVVFCQGDEVRVRTSRLPFIRQQTFSRARLKCVEINRDRS